MKTLPPMVLREIAVLDAFGDRLTVVEMQEMRWVQPLSGPAVPTPVRWYMCNGMEVTPQENGFQYGNRLLLPVSQE